MKLIQFFKNLFRCTCKEHDYVVTAPVVEQSIAPEKPLVEAKPESITQVKVVQKKRKRGRPRKNKQNN